MNIMVFDVPATSGGALSILQEFHAEVYANKDHFDNWVFVLSTPKLEEDKNVKVLNYPWVKRSWLHRLYFDFFIAPQLVMRHQIDRVFSLQNVLIPRTRVSQVLYVHQPLPFVDARFSFLENWRLWFYQNVLSRAIFGSMRRAKRVIVQTEWLRVEGAKKSKVSIEKIHVVRPMINADITTFYENTRQSSSSFFYPASSSVYKNHKVIIEACELLEQQGVHDYRVILTLTGNEDYHVKLLYQKVQEKGLPVLFVGPLKRAEVFRYYPISVLLFPSYVETFGLPLLEAALHGSPIITADTLFAREILDAYPNAHFFNFSNSGDLADLMKKMIFGNLKYTPGAWAFQCVSKQQTLLDHVLC